MTKQGAIKAMKAGAKLKHPSFMQHEWITMEGNRTIITEEGYAISDKEFWGYRTGEYFETGWFIWGALSREAQREAKGEERERCEHCSHELQEEDEGSFCTNQECLDKRVEETDSNGQSEQLKCECENPLPKLNAIELTQVFGSKNCQYSILENKMQQLYENQEKILEAIKLVGNYR